jgi:uncharacterized protein (TIGR00255 family)
MESMTGYGRSEVSTTQLHLTIETRSVNHRYLDVSVRSPRVYAPLEARVKQLVGQHVSRGHIDVIIAEKHTGAGRRTLSLDLELARQYYAALQQVQAALQLSGSIDVNLILGLRDVLSVEEVTADLEEIWGLLAPGLGEALQALQQMRRQEGEFLGRDMQERLRTLSTHVAAIRQRVPLVLTEYRHRLEQRLQELFGQFPLDAERISQEVILFAERSDVTEELTRLEAHLQACARLLVSSEAVGRKTEFLLQEMHREVNTLAAKSNDVDIAQRVVEMKSELERLREQIQNVE